MNRKSLAQALKGNPDDSRRRYSPDAYAPVSGCEDTSRASCTPPSQARRCALPPAQSTPRPARGDAARRWQHRRIRAPRALCPSPPRRRRIVRRPRRTGAAPCVAPTSPCAGMSCLAPVSCPTVPAPRPRAQSPRSSRASTRSWLAGATARCRPSRRRLMPTSGFRRPVGSPEAGTRRIGVRASRERRPSQIPRVDAVMTDDVFEIVARLLRAGKAPTAKAVRQRIRLVFDWCIGQGFRTDNPANGAGPPD